MKPLRLRDDMNAIVEHIRQGVPLIGPVTVRRLTGSDTRRWGFADGRRANAQTVEALCRRGILAVKERGEKREAVLEEGPH